MLNANLVYIRLTVNICCVNIFYNLYNDEKNERLPGYVKLFLNICISNHVNTQNNTWISTCCTCEQTRRQSSCHVGIYWQVLISFLVAITMVIVMIVT